MRNLWLSLVLAVAPLAGANDSIDLLYMGEQRPMVLRLKIRVDGKSLQQTWRGYVDSLFDRLDANNDQVLSTSEFAGAPKPNELARNGLLESVEDNLPDADSNGDDRVTKDELRIYFRRLGANGFSFRVIQRRTMEDPLDPVTGEPLSSGFFKLVDRNRDQLLSAKELKHAYHALQKFDRDDDESVSIRELGMVFSIEQIQGLPLPRKRRSRTRFIKLHPETHQETSRVLLDRYEKNGDAKLSRAESGLGSKRFDQLDANADEFLSSIELQTFLRSAVPAAQVTLDLRRNKPGKVRVSQPENSPQRNTQQLRNDASILRLDRSQIDVIVRPHSRVKDDLARYKRIFARADGDKNGYLDLTESRRFRNFRSTFTGMDRDQDDKVFAGEMMAYAINEAALANAHIALIVTEQGRDLAEILDVDRDSRLSRREIIGAIDRLKEWDKNGDGQIGRGEVPTQHSLSLGRSRPQLFVARVPDRVSPSPARTSNKAPVWFRKMDRNGDGDLSRREFLGTAKVFKRFDKNNDDLISPDEATAKK